MFDIALNILECTMIALFYKSFSNQKDFRAWIYTFIYILISFCTITLFNTLPLNESFFFLLDVLMGYIYLCMVTGLSGFQKLIIAILPTFIISVVSQPVTILLSQIFYHRIDYAALAKEHYLLLTVVTQPLRACLFYFVSKRIRKQEYYFTKKEYIVFFAILLITEFMDVAIGNLIFVDIYDGVSITYAILCMICLLILIFYVFTDISFIQKTVKDQELQIAILENQISSNQKLLVAQEKLYKLRHDLKHFINVTAMGDNDEINSLKEKYKDLADQNIIPVNTSSKALNYVFSIKKQEAADKGIDFLSALNIVEDIEMEDADLYLLLSNLLDNAIQHIGIKNKIYAEITCKNHQLLIRITNSHDQKVLDENHNVKIFRNDKHGYGIETVRLLLKKYNGRLYLDENDSSFVALALVPMTKGPHTFRQ